MPESYRAMEERHAALDAHEQQQEYDARWAGYQSSPDVAEVKPSVPRDCTTCCYAQGDAAPYFCIAHGRLVIDDGQRGCSGWPWDPKDEVAA